MACMTEGWVGFQMWGEGKGEPIGAVKSPFASLPRAAFYACRCSYDTSTHHTARQESGPTCCGHVPRELHAEGGSSIVLSGPRPRGPYRSPVDEVTAARRVVRSCWPGDEIAMPSRFIRPA